MDNKMEYLTSEQAISLIESLAKSQGFYSRLYEQIINFTSEDLKDFEQFINNKKFKSDLDFILYLEG